MSFSEICKEQLGERVFALLLSDTGQANLRMRVYQLFLVFCAAHRIQPITDCADRLKPDSWWQAFGSNGQRVRYEPIDFVGPMLDPTFYMEGSGPVEAPSPIFPEKGNGPRT